MENHSNNTSYNLDNIIGSYSLNLHELKSLLDKMNDFSDDCNFKISELFPKNYDIALQLMELKTNNTPKFLLTIEAHNGEGKLTFMDRILYNNYLDFKSWYEYYNEAFSKGILANYRHTDGTEYSLENINISLKYESIHERFYSHNYTINSLKIA